MVEFPKPNNEQIIKGGIESERSDIDTVRGLEGRLYTFVTEKDIFQSNLTPEYFGDNHKAREILNNNEEKVFELIKSVLGDNAGTLQMVEPLELSDPELLALYYRVSKMLEDGRSMRNLGQ